MYQNRSFTLVWVFAAVFAGTILGVERPNLVVGWLGLVCVAVAWVFHEYKGWKHSGYLFLGLVVGLAYVNSSLAAPPVWNGQHVEVTGVVQDCTETTFYQRVLVSTRQFGGLAAHLPLTMSIQQGSEIRLAGRVFPAQPAGNPGEFCYRSFLASRGVYGVLEPEEVSLAPPSRYRVHVRLAEWFSANLNRSLQEDWLAQALVLGRREHLPQQTTMLWRDLGISHLLAISGMHVGFLALVLFALTQRIGVSGGWSLATVGVILLLYVLVSGGRPSAWRALVASVLILVGRWRGSRAESLQGWGLAGSLLLFFSPHLVRDIGFQFSFAASGMILWWVPLLRKVSGGRGWAARVAGKVMAAIFVSVLAQIGLIPLLVYRFGEVALLGPVATLVFLPFVLVVLVGGLLTALVGPLLPLIPGLVSGATQAVVVLGEALHPFSIVRRLEFPGYFISCIWYGLFFGAGWIGRRRHLCFPQQTVLRAVIISLMAMVPVVYQPWLVPLEVTVLDVGQGDAIYIRTPFRQHILIDGGGDSVYWQLRGRDVGRDRVVPYLRYRGVERIDALILTHPHEDHLFGLLAVLQELEVGLVVDNGMPHTTRSYQRYLELIESQGLVRNVVAAGDSLQFRGGIELQVLHPQHILRGTRSDLNNNSVVLLLEYGWNRLLFTGDLDREGQEDLRSRGVPEVDWLKVPHHGSYEAWNPSFYDELAPRYAVISVGRNSFGHPSPELLSELNARGLEVFRTDEHGAVTFSVGRFTLRPSN